MGLLKTSIYQGWRPSGREPVVTVDDGPLDPCFFIRSHSPSGLEWGYSGSGPAQAALAILFHHMIHFVGMNKGTAIKKSQKAYQPFKRHVIACLPPKWIMESRAVEEFRTMLFRESGGQPVDWNLWRASAFERGVIVANEGSPVIRV
jgi:hypothetical protein